MRVSGGLRIGTAKWRIRTRKIRFPDAIDCYAVTTVLSISQDVRLPFSSKWNLLSVWFLIMRPSPKKSALAEPDNYY